MSRKVRKLLKENNQFDKKLSEEAGKVMTDMVVYIRGANISNYNQELVRRDILQMVYDGEQRGEDIQTVIGEDYKSFCENVLSEVPKLTTKERMIKGVGNGSLYLATLLFIRVVFGMMDFLEKKDSGFLLPITLGNVISTLLIIGSAIGIFMLFTRFSFDRDFLTSKKMLLILFVILFACMATNTFLYSVLFYINALILVTVAVILYVVYKVIDARD